VGERKINSETMERDTSSVTNIAHDK